MVKRKKNINETVLSEIKNTAEYRVMTEIKEMAVKSFKTNMRTNNCIIDICTMHFYCHNCGREGIAEKGICECGKILTKFIPYNEKMNYEIRYEQSGFWICMYASWELRWVDSAEPYISLSYMYL